MLKRHRREISVAVVLVALWAVLAIAAPTFFARDSLVQLLAGTAPLLIVACGMALVIIARQIDISVGSQFALCGILAGLAAQAGWPMPLVALAATLTGAALGAVNGLLVAGLGLPSIVVTLATMVAWRETLRWWREGAFVRDLPEGFQWFGLGQGAGQTVVIGAAAMVFFALVVGLQSLAGGRYVYAVGSDAEAARLLGIRPRWVTGAVFVVLGLLTGLAALLGAVRFADVDPKSGQGLELQAIAAAVVGGVAIRGGRGSLWGVLLGVLLLACIGPALVFLHVEPQWEKAIQGGIILLAVAADGCRGHQRGAVDE